MEFKKKKIGIDLDDTIWKFHEKFFEYYNNRFGTNFFVEDYIVYDMEKFLGIKRDNIFLFFDDYEKHEDYRILPLIDYVEDVFLEVLEKYDVYFITARSSRTADLVKERIFRHFGVDVKTVFIHDDNWNKIEEKVDFCLREGIELLIDDSYYNLKLCAEKGVKGILLTYPWNKDKKLVDGIIRVNNWKEIMDVFENEF
jgi:uncharacterized HAD superfamily protein